MQIALLFHDTTGDSRTGRVGSVWYQIPVCPPVGEPRAPETPSQVWRIARGRVGVAYVGAKLVPPTASERRFALGCSTRADGSIEPYRAT